MNMHAWRIEQHGGPEVLKRVELPIPTPGPMEARIRIEAVGLNHLDLWMRKGVPGHHFPLPLTPGCDIAGVVDDFGSGAEQSLARDGIKKNSAVLLNPGISCGRCEACLGGFDPLCPHYGIIGETRDGGCAPFVIAPVSNIIQRPPSLTAVHAAALPIPYVTAWTMLMKKAQLRPGETVLIQAGGSGVSVAAIQIAKFFGAVVITTVGSDEKISKAKELGADYVINYKKTSFREEVKRILASQNKKGVEIVLDHVGGETFQESLRCLAWGGRIVTCGATAGAKIEIDLKPLFFKNISILGSTMGSKADLLRIVHLTALGRFQPIIDSIFSIDQLPEAFQKLESRNVFGKVIITA